jgi:hypothetical protein
MLTLFVLPSGMPNADLNQTVQSFNRSGIPFKTVQVTDWREINAYDKDKWYGIFWDNEGIDANLETALPIHLGHNKADALIVYKRIAEKEAEYRPRFFRCAVWLKEGFAPLATFITYETILDGWIKEWVTLSK